MQQRKIYFLFTLIITSLVIFFFSCNMSASQKEEEPEEKNVTITGINVAALPNKVLYSTHEELVTSGLKINIVYSDGSTEECTNYTLFLENEERITNQSFSNCKAGPLTIYVKYNDVEYGTYTTQFSITIKKSAVNFYAAHELNKTEYTQEEKLDLRGLELRLDYNDDTSQIITEGYSIKIYSLNLEELNFSQEDLDNLNIPNHLDLGQYYIKFIYEEDNVVFSSDFMSFNVIQDSEIPNIIAADISRQPDKTVFNIDEQITLTGIEFEYTTSDGQVYPYYGEYKILYWNNDIQEYVELPSTLTEGDYLVYVKCEIELNGEVAWTIFSPISICVQDKNNPQNPPEEIPPEEQFKGLQLKTYPSKTTYTEGEKLDLTGIEIYYYDGNWDTHPFTQEYTVKLYNKDTEEYFDLDAKLKAGSYSVEIIYNDGNTDWTTNFMITVVCVTDISEFSYKETEGGIVIGGFKGKEIKDSEEDTLYDYDAPYETVYSEPSDFIYELIEGSETDVRIVSVNPDKCKIITDMTIPAHIDGYNVKEISCDAFIKTKGEYEYEEFSTYKTAVRNLEIEEGVERFVYGSFWQDCYSYTSFFFYQFPYLKKLILPKGFNLYLSKEFEDKFKGSEDAYEERRSSNYTFHLTCHGLEEIQLPSDLKKIDFSINFDRLKKLVIPASVEKIQYYSGESWFLENCEEIVFEGTTNISVRLWIPKIKELTFTGDVSVELVNAPALERVIFTGNAKGVIGADFSDKQYAPNKLEEIIIDEPENDEVYIGGGYKPYYTSYGDYTVTAGFKDLKSLKKVTLNLKEDAKVIIGEQAFKNCTSLEEIALTNHVVEVNKQAFMNCTALKSVKFAQSCQLKIGESSFHGCTALENISFPQLSTGYEPIWLYELERHIRGDIMINTNAFYNVPAINEFTFKKDMSYDLEKGAFFGCDIKNLTFEENCEVFGAVEYVDAWTRETDKSTSHEYIVEAVDVFDANSSIKEIDISVANKVYDLKFDNFTALQKFTVGNSSFIGGSLKNCTSLQTIDVGENACFLPSSLQGCSSLQSVTLQSNSVYAHISSYQYYPESGGTPSEILSDCDSLRSVTFKNLKTPPYVFGKDGRDTECDLIFDNVVIGDYSFYKCNFITSVNPVAISGDYCLAECKNLKQVTTINISGEGIFKDCVNLESVTTDWSNAFETNCFYNCKNLKSVTSTVAKDSLERYIFTFGENCFYNCNKLENLDFISQIEYFILAENCFNGNESVLQIFKAKNIPMEGLIWLLAFQNTSFLLEDLTVEYSWTNISGISAKNIFIPRSLYYFIPRGFAENNKFIQTVTLDCDIEARAFKGCSSLTTVILGDTTFHSVCSDSFAYCPNLSKIIVPARFFEQYKTSSKWELYRDLICTE